MPQGRAQTPDLSIQQLRPQAISGDTFVQAARAPEDHSTDALLRALGATNANLVRAADNMAIARQKDEAAEVQRQKNITMMASPGARSEIARTGVLPDGTAIKDLQLLRMAGSIEGASFHENAQKSLMGRDLTGVDVDAEIDRLAAPYLKDYGHNDFVLGGFLPQVDQAKAWARNAQTQQGLQVRKTTEEGTTFDFLSRGVDEWSKPEAGPEAMKTGLQDLYSNLAAGQSALATPELLDQYRVQKAAMVVDTNPELAKAILAQEVTGPDGKPRRSLASDPQYAGRVADILQQGAVATAKAEVSQGFNQRRQDNFRRVVQGGDWTAFQDLEIHGKKLTETEQKVQFVGDLAASLDAQVEAGRMTAVQKMQEIARYTSRMNIDDPFIKGELEGIEARYSTVDALNDPEYLQDIEGRAAAFTAYGATHRQSLKRQLSDKSFSWLEDFGLYKRYVDPSTEGAAEFANRVTNPPAGWDQGIGKQREKVITEVRNKLSGTFVDDSDAFKGAYEAEVTNLAGKFVALGMNQSAAVDAAVDKVFANRVHFGGDPLFGLEKAGLPEDYQDIMKRMVEQYRVMDARGKAYKGTATFIALEGGVIAMRDRETGSFLEGQNGRLIAFDVQHLREVSARLAKQKRDEAVKAAVDYQNETSKAVEESGRLGMADFMDQEPAPPAERPKSPSRADRPRAWQNAAQPEEPAQDDGWVDPALLNKGVR